MSSLLTPNLYILSAAESDRFKKAFEDPEFRTLFSEYMDEIQNPAYREETEMYINQLEGENKVPSGKQLIRSGLLNTKEDEITDYISNIYLM